MRIPLHKFVFREQEQRVLYQQRSERAAETFSDRTSGSREGALRDSKGQREKLKKKIASKLKPAYQKHIAAYMDLRHAWSERCDTLTRQARERANDPGPHEDPAALEREAKRFEQEKMVITMAFDALIKLQTEPHEHEGKQMVWDLEGFVYDFIPQLDPQNRFSFQIDVRQKSTSIAVTTLVPDGERFTAEELTGKLAAFLEKQTLNGIRVSAERVLH